MCKAALERFTTGLAAEVYESGIAVNVLSPAGIVPTPGVMHHQLVRPGMESFVEPPEVMAEAALVLCTGDPAAVTGRRGLQPPAARRVRHRAPCPSRPRPVRFAYSRAPAERYLLRGNSL